MTPHSFFCGDRRAARSPYCQRHSRIAFNRSWTPRAALDAEAQQAATRQLAAVAAAYTA